MSEKASQNLAGFSLNQRELYSRLGWLIKVRWVVLIGACIGLMLTRYRMGDSNPLRACLVGIMAVAAYNLLFHVVYFYLHHWTQPARWKNILFAWVQICLDLFALTGLVHLTGGAESGFVIFYLVHLVIAATLLRMPHSFALAAVASLLFDSLVFLEYQGVLQRFHLIGLSLGPHLDGSPLSRAFPLICLVYNGGFFFTVYVVASISERLRSREREIEAVNRQLEQINAVKSEFMRMTGHEMRAPLVAVKGMLSLLERESGQNPESRCGEMVYRCQKRVDALEELIQDLLEYSHLQVVDYYNPPQALEMGQLAQWAIDEFAPIAENRRINLKLETKPCCVWADEEQIAILVKNLLSNGLRYTPEGGAVTLRLWEEEDWGVIQVEDTGIGIETESLLCIFEEFYRAPEAKEHEPGGTGLGLTLCKKIVERHKGKIRVQSDTQQGTIFTVRLPRCKNECPPVFP